MFGVGSVLESVLSTAINSMQDTVEKFESNDVEAKKIVEVAERMSGLKGMDGVEIKTRKWRLRTFKAVFVGREAVDWLIAKGLCKNQREAVVLGNRMVRLKIIQKVNGAGRFENANFFYRFVGNYRQAETLHDSDIKRLGFGHADLSQIVATMYNDPTPLVTRSYQTLSVIGSQAVQFFLSKSLVTNTRDAVILGNLLIKDALLVAGQYKYNPTNGALHSAAGKQPDDGLNGGHGNGMGLGVGVGNGGGGGNGTAPASPAAASAASIITGYPFRNADLVYYITGPLLEAHIQSERARELALQKAELAKAQSAAEAAAGAGTPTGPLTPHLAGGQQLSKPHDVSPLPHADHLSVASSIASASSVPPIAGVHHAKTGSASSSSGVNTPHSSSFSSSAGNAAAAAAAAAVANGANGHAHATAHPDGSISLDKPVDSTANLVPKHPHPPSALTSGSGSGGSVVAAALKAAAAASDKKSSLLVDDPASQLPVQFDWEFVQSFGDDSSAYDYDDAEDLVTAVEFDHSGEYLAIGDKAGRISIVQETTQRQKNMPLEYKFYTEFQSHEPEFDALKSMETEPKINVIKWLKHHTHSMHLLTCNDKTIKLWRVGEKRVRPANGARPRGSSLTVGLSADHKGDFTPVEDEQPGGVGANGTAAGGGASSVIRTVHKATFKNAHGYNIHSLSMNCDGETFFSADDLRINMWSLQRSDECMTIVDVKPEHVTDIDELITSAAFHPTHCHLLMYGSSKGAVRLGDMRQRALVDRHTTHFENKALTKKTYFSEITNSILDAKFSANGRYIIARDYMTVRLWDVHMPSKPLTIVQVHPQFNTQQQLSTLLDNECIFDQFQCALSADGLHFVTGSYSNCFLIQNTLTKTGVTIEARDDVREPRICAVQSQPIVAAHESKSRLVGGHHSAAGAGGSAGGSAVGGADAALSATAAAAAKSKAAAFAAAVANIKMPVVNHKIEAAAYRNKVLRVAWHPRLNAVAVAGLYKLYLYQTKPNAAATAAGGSPPQNHTLT